MLFLALTLTILNSLALFMLWRHRQLNPVVRFCLTAYFLVWVVVPFGLGLISRGSAIPWHYLTADQFWACGSIEVLALLMLNVALLLFSTRATVYIKWLIPKASETTLHYEESLVFTAVLLVMPLCVPITWLVIKLAGSTYSEFNEFGTSEADVTGPVTLFMEFLGIVSSLAYACILAGRSDAKNQTIVKSICWWFVLFLAFANLLIGARRFLLIPLMLVLLKSQLQKSESRSWALPIVLGLTLFLAPSILIGIGHLRVHQEEGISRIAMFTSGSQSQSRTLSEYLDQMGYELSAKLNTVAYGAILIDQYGIGGGGWQTIGSCAYSLVPRILYPDKPIPGSKNGTIFETPHRLVAASLSMTVAGNVGVSPVLQSVWQTGGAGPIIFISLCFLHLVMISALLDSKSLFIKAIGFRLLGLPLLDFFMPAPDMALLVLQRTLIYIVLVGVILKALSHVGGAKLLWHKNPV